jgi:cyclopropane fatty-acyl-phospholipid synthase-like methyltransferase|tara:strand:+ start:2369 stop:3136 length:768 start_codon:yes stop_codon:yes gene_type:complete
MNSEIIKNNIFKYNFIKKFVNGRIFDHQQNVFTAYTSAKILLENNVSEVYSSNTLNSKKKDLRKYNEKLEIDFNIENIKNCENYFDSIISFENINKKNYSENIENYFLCLKEKGILIISVLNNKQNEKNINKFTLDELNKLVNLKFKILEVYSQRFIEKSINKQNENIFKKIRKFLAFILIKIDKNRLLYIKYFQKNISKFDSFNENIKKISDEDYIPIKYDKNNEPMYLILVCEKIEQLHIKRDLINKYKKEKE